MALGSRGDLQPFVALGRGLKASGIRVMVVTSKNFATFVTSAGLQVIPAWESTEAVLNSDPRAPKLVAAGRQSGLLKLVKTAELATYAEVYKRVGEALRQERPDVLVYNYLARPLAQFAWIKYQVPRIKVELYRNPYSPTVEGRPPMSMPDLPLGLSRLWAPLMAHNLYRHSLKLDAICERVEGVAPYRNFSFWQFYGQLADLESSQVRHLSLVAATKLTQALVPKSKPPSNTIITGPFVMDARDQEVSDSDGAFGGASVKAELTAFLDAGEPPVCIGFGSLVLPGEPLVKLAVAALKKAGKRGVVVAGWARLSTEKLASAVKEDGDPQGLVQYAADNVLFVPRAPHEQLFPLCAVAVHHGALGTLSATLRSGIPVVITPARKFTEYAELVETLGVGRRCRLVTEVTAEELAEAIAGVDSDKVVKARAEAVSTIVRAERGVEGAVELITAYLRTDVETGRAQEQWVREQCLLNKAQARRRRRQGLLRALATAATAVWLGLKLSSRRRPTC